jgi:hypothetical protein
MQLALSTRALVELRIARKGVRDVARRTIEACVAQYRRRRFDEQKGERL